MLPLLKTREKISEQTTVKITCRNSGMIKVMQTHHVDVLAALFFLIYNNVWYTQQSSSLYFVLSAVRLKVSFKKHMS